MNFNIFTTPHFEKELKALVKHYRSMKEDYGSFMESLKKNPFQGTNLGSGLRKMFAKIQRVCRAKSGWVANLTLRQLTFDKG